MQTTVLCQMLVTSKIKIKIIRLGYQAVVMEFQQYVI